MKTITRQTGAGLVEIMIGFFIGSLILLSVYGSLNFYANIKRGAAGANSALSTAFTSAFFMNQDISGIGLGMNTSGALACSTLNAYYNGSTVSNGAALLPIRVTDNNGAPDSISLMSGTSINGGAPMMTISDMSDPNDSIALNSAANLVTNNMFLITNSSGTSPCTLFQATSITNDGVYNRVYHSNVGSLVNPASPVLSFSTAPTYPSGSYVFNLGGFTWVTWRINAGNLERVNNLTGAVEVVGENVVQMRIEYGTSNPGSTALDAWTPATGTWASLTPALTERIRAVRIALVVQSKHQEKPPTTGGVCNATTTGPIPWPGGTAIDLSTVTNWKCYRYEVVRSVIPLKNIMWGNVS